VFAHRGARARDKGPSAAEPHLAEANHAIALDYAACVALAFNCSAW
jgi:hypothetical protein